MSAVSARDIVKTFKKDRGALTDLRLVVINAVLTRGY